MKRVEIVQLPLAALEALAAGDLAGANRAAPVAMGAAFVDDDWRGTWRMRAAQVAADAEAAAWVTGVVWDVDIGCAVGRAGFHAPPDARGMVEVGYAIDAELRRRGYGSATLAWLIARAAREQAVTVVRASVAPENAASLALIARFAFVQVGEQIDPEDGLELVFERAAR